MNGFQGISGVRVHRYAEGKGTAKDIHPWLADFESKVIRGVAAYQMACCLADQGYTPDLILAHPGWGESLFLNRYGPRLSC